MNKMIAILLTLLLFFGILSCNLDGAGIFLTISESTEIADSNLATEPVRDILYIDTNTMYILHRTSVKSADISAADPTWTNIAFPTPISEAVFVPGTTDKLFYSSVNLDDKTKTVYVCPVSTPSSATSISSLENIQVIDIINDSTTVYVITYGDGEITISEINTASSDTILSTNTFSSTIAPIAVHFVSNGSTAANKHFIFVHPDVTQGYINSFLTLSDLSTATVFPEFTNTVFDVSDDAAKNSPIIGTYTYGGIIYLVTYEGILITADNDFITFTAVNALDSSEYMSIVLNASVFSIPMTIVTKPDTTELLLIGGLSNIYYSDISTGANKPVEFTSTDTFYSNFSSTSTQIMDFYNVPGDFSFYTATSNKWIWKTTDEGEASTQLL